MTEALSAAYEMALGLFRVGVMDEITMRKIEAIVHKIPSVDSGSCDLPNGCELFWKRNAAGGRSYYSNEVGVDVLVWDTAVVDQTTLLAAMTKEAELSMIEYRRLKG